MKTLVPAAITQANRSPVKKAIQAVLLENLSLSTKLFSPTEELYEFIQKFGYLMFYNMGALRYALYQI